MEKKNQLFFIDIFSFCRVSLFVNSPSFVFLENKEQLSSIFVSDQGGGRRRTYIKSIMVPRVRTAHEGSKSRVNVMDWLAVREVNSRLINKLLTLF